MHFSIWFIIIGLVLLVAGIALYFLTDWQTLISIVIGALGTLLLIFGFVMFFMRNEKQGSSIEKQVAYSVRDKIDKVVPMTGKLLTDTSISVSQGIVRGGLRTGTLVNKAVYKTIRGAISGIIKVEKIVLVALFGLLLSESGIGEIAWLGEIGSILGSLGFSGGSTVGSVVSGIGGLGAGNLFGQVASVGGSALSSIGSGVGSAALGSVGSTLSSAGSTALSNVGVNLGLQIGESLTREGVTQVGNKVASVASKQIPAYLQNY